MTTTARIIEELKANGFIGKLWTKIGIARIYIEAGRKDAKVYLDLDMDGDVVIGAALKVYVDAGRQSFAWAKAQNQIVRQRFESAFKCYVRAMYQPSDAADGSGYGADIRNMIVAAYAVETEAA